MDEKDKNLLDGALCATNLTHLRDKFVSEKVEHSNIRYDRYIYLNAITKMVVM